MNRGNGVTAYVIMMFVFMTALALGAAYFVTGMHASSYMITDGIGYLIRFIDKPRYDRHLLGLIYTVAFFLAGLLLLFIIAMPDERMLASWRRQPPQPRRRRAAGAPPAEPVRSEARPLAIPREAPLPSAAALPREAAPAPAPAAAPVVTAVPVVTMEEAVMEEAEAAAIAAPVAPPPPKPEIPVDLAAQVEVPEVSEADLPSARVELSGEEDVVYGDGPVTQDSIVEFIQNYPDSAVKFLYRKNLDNRPLPPTDEDIYTRWERRGMSRAKVRAFVLEIMEWEKLPDDFPHNIWMRLRDRIYELKSEMKSR